jgi:uncharacterized membrane-anchored protein
METYDSREAGKRQVSLQARRHGEAGAAGEARPGRTAARHIVQAERAVMHPDCNDLEWHYCLNGWAG